MSEMKQSETELCVDIIKQLKWTEGGVTAMLNYKRYRRNPVVDYPEREWADKQIEKAPVWCSVDLARRQSGAD